MLRYINAVMISISIVLMIFTVYRYQNLLTHFHQETYSRERPKVVLLPLVLLYIFVGGLFVGLFDLLTRNVEPIYNFVAVIFCLGTVFILLAVESQRNMAIMLRNKSTEVMITFINAIDMKDTYTKGHSEHVYRIVDAFYNVLSDDYRSLINKPKLLDAAMLHDIGKISIDDAVLNKATPLTEDEWATIRKHPLEGKAMLDDTSFREIGKWVLYHHERIDGQGYYQLPGDKIPLEARIIAIADTYSALVTDRIYRAGKMHSEAIAIMQEAAGTQLDADLLRYFLRIGLSELSKYDIAS